MNNILVVFTKPDREYESNFWMKESDLFMKPEKKKLYVGIKRESLDNNFKTFETTHAYKDFDKLKFILCNENYDIHEIEVQE